MTAFTLVKERVITCSEVSTMGIATYPMELQLCFVVADCDIVELNVCPLSQKPN